MEKKKEILTQADIAEILGLTAPAPKPVKTEGEPTEADPWVEFLLSLCKGK